MSAALKITLVNLCDAAFHGFSCHAVYYYLPTTFFNFEALHFLPSIVTAAAVGK